MANEKESETDKLIRLFLEEHPDEKPKFIRMCHEMDRQVREKKARGLL